MKRFIVLLLLGFGLQRTMLAQGTIGSPDLLLGINFVAVSNSPADALPSGSASYSRIPFFGLGTNVLNIDITTGTNQANGGRILEIQNDGTLTTVMELTNETLISLPVFPLNPAGYGYIQSLQLTIDQIQSLLAGKWYAEVDFGNDTYLGNLTPVSSSLRTPQAVISNSPFSEFSNVLENVVIAPNNQTVKIVLDGSASTDVFNLPLQYLWTDGNNPFSTAAVITNVFSVGTHQISLQVNDGYYSNAFVLTLQVVTPSEAIGIVISMIDQSNLENNEKRQLTKILLDAAASFKRNNSFSAISHLQAFQSQIRKHITRFNSTDATSVMNAAQEIINVFTLPVLMPRH